MPPITTHACTSPGEKREPGVLPCTSFPPTVQNSIPSSVCGSSHVDVACITATSNTEKPSSARWKKNLIVGRFATKPCVGYAQLLKTLCLGAHSDSISTIPHSLSI